MFQHPLALLRLFVGSLPTCARVRDGCWQALMVNGSGMEMEREEQKTLNGAVIGKHEQGLVCEHQIVQQMVHIKMMLVTLKRTDGSAQ